MCSVSIGPPRSGVEKLSGRIHGLRARIYFRFGINRMEFDTASYDPGVDGVLGDPGVCQGCVVTMSLKLSFVSGLMM
jgi:hypothetical protein